MEDKLISAPIPTLRRLPRYIHILKRLKAENIKYVSATVIANELGIESIQVRKDLSLTGIVGKPKVGFELNDLFHSIAQFLNWENQEDAFIVGVGALGEAILGYENFRNYGLNIVAGFDSNPKKIGKEIGNIEILDVEKLHDLVKRMKVNIGVITTPANVAQQTCDTMIIAGIKAIWNFAPIALKVPDDIILENVYLTQSLAVLTHKLHKKLEK